MSGKPYSTERRLEVFFSKVNKTDHCWLWTGSQVQGRRSTAYGQFHNGSKGELAHRFSYRTFVRPIEKDLTIDHLCRNTLCVNPGHLEQVTMRENILRGVSVVAINAKKSLCRSGHLFPTNSKDGEVRNCVTCHRIRSKRNSKTYRQRLKAASALSECVTKHPFHLRCEGCGGDENGAPICTAVECYCGRHNK